ncbi:MAG TPA: hypothetical protein VIJ28_05645 [Chloroflexota bacterium]
MIGKEPLIASDLVSYLIEDTVNERVQKAVTTAVAEVEERQWEWLTHDVEDVLVARFPVTPVALATVIRGMKDHERPQDLHAVLLRAPDQQAAEHLLRQAAE